MFKKNLFIISLLFLVIILMPHNAFAVEYKSYDEGWKVIPDECIDPSTTNPDGTAKRCDANSFVQLFINLAFIMLKLSPPLAMIIFIYAGFRFIGARGKQEDIQAGKKILSSAFLGMFIIIVLGWTSTFFVVQALTGEKSGKLFGDATNIFSRDWWGGGGGTEDNPGNTGTVCCKIIGVGCIMKTPTECSNLSPQYTDLNGIPNIPNVGPATQDPNVDDCLDNKECKTYADNVVNNIWKCCVPHPNRPESADDKCQTPNQQRGCADYLYTYPHTSACNTLVPCGAMPALPSH